MKGGRWLTYRSRSILHIKSMVVVGLIPLFEKLDWSGSYLRFWRGVHGFFSIKRHEEAALAFISAVCLRTDIKLKPLRYPAPFLFPEDNAKQAHSLPTSSSTMRITTTSPSPPLGAYPQLCPQFGRAPTRARIKMMMRMV